MTIDPTTAATTATDTATASGVSGQKSNALGQDAFMQLLVTQLEHQDPTAPQDDGQFIAQLAQFSSLERLTKMDQTLTSINLLLSGLGQPSTTSTPPYGTTGTMGTGTGDTTDPTGTTKTTTNITEAITTAPNTAPAGSVRIEGKE